MGSTDIRVYECIRAGDRAIDMGLGGEVHDDVDLVLPQQRRGQVRSANVPVNHAELRVILRRLQGCPDFRRT